MTDIRPADRRQDVARVPEACSATDEALVLRAQKGDQDALLVLLQRYRWTLRSLARRYFLPGGDVEDLIQEASLGFIKAVRDYRSDLGASFRSFAELCALRQVFTAVKAATRLKHLPLNGAISLQRPRFAEDEDSPTLAEALADNSVPSPEQQLVELEDTTRVLDLMATVLSPYERQVVELYLDGRSYQEIAAACGTHVKSVDNALWRVKCKLRRALGRSGEARNDGVASPHGRPESPVAVPHCPSPTASRTRPPSAAARSV